VKPHGALYNRAVWDEQQAGAVVDAVTAFARAYGRELPVLGLPGSALLRVASAAGLPTVAEAFSDVPTRRRARWCRAVSRARCSMTRAWW
jgi:UPF0271 protein